MGKDKKHPWEEKFDCRINPNIRKKLHETTEEIRKQLEARKKDPCIQDLVKIVEDTEKVLGVVRKDKDYIQGFNETCTVAYKEIKNVLKWYSCL